jgi:hypothetical protein
MALSSSRMKDQNASFYTVYPILKTQMPNGGKTSSAENSRPFHGSFSVLTLFKLVVPFPPYSTASELNI